MTLELNVWRKSSYSAGSNSACVEVATWRKSSYSTGANSQCVEVAAGEGVVGVRDSKDPDGGRLAVSGRAWRAFLTDLPESR